MCLAHVDPQLIPSHIRPHLTPAIRKLSLDFTIPCSTPNSNPTLECDRLRAENASLRSCCEIWRKRAAVHAAASLGLVGLARLARDHAIKMRKECTDLHHKYNDLKRKHDAYEASESSSSEYVTHAPPTHCPLKLTPLRRLTTPPMLSELPQLTRSPSTPPSPPRRHARSPSPCASELSYCSDCSDCEPALKRLRVSSYEPEVKRSPATSPILALSPAPFEDA